MKFLKKSWILTAAMGAGLLATGVALADNANVHNPQGQWQTVVYTKKQAPFKATGTNAMITPSSQGRGSVVVYISPNGNEVYSVDVQGPGGKILASASNIVKNSNGTFSATVNVGGAAITLIINSNGSLMSATEPSNSPNTGLIDAVVAATGA